MIIKFENIKENPVNLLRKAGYTFRKKEDKEISFVRSFSQSGFPRFHIYSSLKDGVLVINLHLDQKNHTYGDGTRHHGEYEDSDLVKEEAERIRKLID